MAQLMEDFKRTGFPDTAWQEHIQLTDQHSRKLDKIPAWRRGGGRRTPCQAEELLAFDCCREIESQFSSVE